VLKIQDIQALIISYIYIYIFLHLLFVNNTSVKIGIVSVKLRDRLVSNILPLLLYKEEVL
jgi:hypothetical protein